MAAQPIIKYPYLISKFFDPIFGIAIGIMAFGTYEKRVGREDGHTLRELVAAKFGKPQTAESPAAAAAPAAESK